MLKRKSSKLSGVKTRRGSSANAKNVKEQQGLKFKNTTNEVDLDAYFNTLLKADALRGGGSSEALDYVFVREVAVSSDKTGYVVNMQPVVLLMCNEDVKCFHLESLELLYAYRHDEISMLAVDNTRKDHLLSIVLFDVAAPLYFCCGEQSTLEGVVQYFESGRARICARFPEVPPLPVRSTPLFGGRPTLSSNVVVEEVFAELSLAGFTESDVWDGVVDLLSVVSGFRDLIPLEPHTRCPVEFVLPQVPELTSQGLFRKVYKVDIDQPVRELLAAITSRLGLKDTSKYAVRPIKGKLFDADATLADYGLGTLFVSWQLKLVDRANPDSTGNFLLEIALPDIEAIRALGISKKTLAVDAYIPVQKVVQALCAKLKLPDAHYYELELDGKRLHYNDHLSSHGLGVKFKACKLTLVVASLPMASGDRAADTALVRSVLLDVVGEAEKIAREVRRKRGEGMAAEIVNGLLSRVLFQIEKAHTVPVRVASLSAPARDAVYELLYKEECEDMILFKVAGYNAAIEAVHAAEEAGQAQFRADFLAQKPRHPQPETYVGAPADNNDAAIVLGEDTHKKRVKPTYGKGGLNIMGMMPNQGKGPSMRELKVARAAGGDLRNQLAGALGGLRKMKSPRGDEGAGQGGGGGGGIDVAGGLARLKKTTPRSGGGGGAGGGGGGDINSANTMAAALTGLKKTKPREPRGVGSGGAGSRDVSQDDLVKNALGGLKKTKRREHAATAGAPPPVGALPPAVAAINLRKTPAPKGAGGPSGIPPPINSNEVIDASILRKSGSRGAEGATRRKALPPPPQQNELLAKLKKRRDTTT